MKDKIGDFQFWLMVFGALLAAAPVISLIQRIFSPELVPVLAAFIDFYRGLVGVVVDFLFGWTEWRPWQAPPYLPCLALVHIGVIEIYGVVVCEGAAGIVGVLCRVDDVGRCAWVEMV